MRKKDKKQFKNLEKQWKDIFSMLPNPEIPTELNSIVENAMIEGEYRNAQQFPRKKYHLGLKLIVACSIVLIVMLNISPVVAKTMHNIPVVGTIFKFFTFREYHFEDDIKYIDVKIPEFTNTGKSDLEERINKEIQYFIHEEVKSSEQDAQDYYEAFIQTGGKKEDFIPLGITVDYKVYCSSEDIVSFSISKYETAFNAYNSKKFYNIDMRTGKYLTIKDYLGNDYKKIVLNGINAEIANWPQEKKESLWQGLDFTKLVSENMNFYIDQEKNPVVVFDKYEIAYGSQGEISFTIHLSELDSNQEEK